MAHQKLHAVKFALAGGIITAICIFLITIAALIWTGYAVKSIAFLIDIYGFLGYKLSFFGAILGAIYGFIYGFILTWIFAWVYNKLF